MLKVFLALSPIQHRVVWFGEVDGGAQEGEGILVEEFCLLEVGFRSAVEGWLDDILEEPCFNSFHHLVWCWKITRFSLTLLSPVFCKRVNSMHIGLFFPLVQVV